MKRDIKFKLFPRNRNRNRLALERTVLPSVENLRGGCHLHDSEVERMRWRWQRVRVSMIEGRMIQGMSARNLDLGVDFDGKPIVVAGEFFEILDQNDDYRLVRISDVEQVRYFRGGAPD